MRTDGNTRPKLNVDDHRFPSFPNGMGSLSGRSMLDDDVIHAMKALLPVRGLDVYSSVMKSIHGNSACSVAPAADVEPGFGRRVQGSIEYESEEGGGDHSAVCPAASCGQPLAVMLHVEVAASVLRVVNTADYYLRLYSRKVDHSGRKAVRCLRRT
ncbi:hypothetical protein HPP92_026019 [Vanilla planifolia]|uniref:Uncharacterized protein n=1 Tax=Vanilla planifolia TaxID=51239 RepID=A0A835PDJ9_VANPL|nr:hypothetical protein HPP92_026296 [Vanilla planifolia]KAG0451761.1 hypothetical protein HPP92_026019 [Vanilla planifolia]